MWVLWGSAGRGAVGQTTKKQPAAAGWARSCCGLTECEAQGASLVSTPPSVHGSGSTWKGACMGCKGGLPGTGDHHAAGLPQLNGMRCVQPRVHLQPLQLCPCDTLSSSAMQQDVVRQALLSAAARAPRVLQGCVPLLGCRGVWCGGFRGTTREKVGYQAQACCDLWATRVRVPASAVHILCLVGVGTCTMGMPPQCGNGVGLQSRGDVCMCQAYVVW